VINRDDDEVVRVTAVARHQWAACANAPSCEMPADDIYGGGVTDDGRRICRHCSRIERGRMARWVRAGSPDQAASMAKIRAILKTTPKWKLQMLGDMPENFSHATAHREPGSDDE